jgi:hypothetical protein
VLYNELSFADKEKSRIALHHQPCQGVLRTSAIVAHDEQRENVLIRIERLLMDGVISNGLGFEKLNTDASMGTLISIRLNNKERLLVTNVWLIHGCY